MSPALVVAIVLVLSALGVWGSLAAQAKRREKALVLERMGFRDSPEEKERVLAAVSAIENDRGDALEIRDLKKRDGRPQIFHYTKVKKRTPKDDEPVVGEELLFPLRRRSQDGLVLFLKPSAIRSGLATKLLRVAANATSVAKPEGLERLEVDPLDLRCENLLGALGPRGARLLDLVDSSTLAVLLGLGDFGALEVRLRGAWCSVASIGQHVPFLVQPLVARLEPLAR